MPPLEARRSERVDYNAEVELLARVGAAGSPHRVFAHAFDLGPGGMRVAGPIDMAVGEEVTCRVTLDGRPASLPGRVAWRREASASDALNAHWMGICFEPLGVYESGLLQHVVETSSAGYKPVELHFTGLDQPVVARARARTNGLRLSAALPIFARDTELSFQLDAEGPVFTGRIGDATLREENGARRLEIEVDVIDDGVRFRRRARYGYADEIEAGEQLEVEAARHASLADTQRNARLAPTMRTQRAGGRGNLWTSLLLTAVAGAALTWYASTQLQAETAQETDAEFVARPRALEEALSAVLTREAAPGPAVQAEAAEPEPEPTPVAAEPTPVADTPSAPDTESAAAPAQPEAPAHELTAQVAARSAEPVSSATQAPAADENPAREPAPLPEAESDGDVTRVRIPFVGTLERMHAVVWAEPAALAIDVPGARTSLESGRYAVDRGSVTELRVNKNGGALLLRFRLSAPLARYTITADNGTLEATLQRAAKLLH